ncbi:MAG: thioredoxin family protein [Lentimicrobiaceae bacterium]|nr:thioredoxin family protein [Lentimicrobiaceae bacterium]
MKETPSEVTQTDDYATLRVSNAPQEMTENISGNVITLSEKDFIEQITTIDNPKGFRYLGKTPCIVELYADWCKPCWILSDLMIELAPEYKGKVIFYKLNIDRAPNIVKAFNVENIPMILYFKPREKVANTVGLLNKGNLRKAINDLLLND